MHQWQASLLFCLATTAQAGPFNDLIFFGDSLSDVGNTNFWTAGAFPGSDYDEGRFTNGPVYAELLSERLGLGEVRRDGDNQGGNFAYGGAETDGPGGFAGFFLNSFVEQVDAYLGRLSGAAPDPGTLFIVFIGANDFFNGQTDFNTPAGVVQTEMQRLINAGAQQFLGINLPSLGLTPDNLGDTALTSLSSDYNDALETIYSGLETTNTSVRIHRLDSESLLNDLVANPGAYGFIDTTTPGQEVAGNSLDRAPGYVFWDGVHPTREVHSLLADAAIRAVLPEGDYNRDGFVTVEDVQVWSETFGEHFDAAAGIAPSLAADGNGDGQINAADYTIWRDRFTPLAVSVPEPAIASLVMFGTIALLGLRYRRFE